jgi:hypothetical protein
MITKSTLRENLTKCVARVIFTKTDGSTREMNCTLMEDYIPSKSEPAVRHLPRTENDGVLAVWDLDNSGWRSFRLDSVTSIDYIGVNRV